MNKKGTTNFKKLLREMETLKEAVMGKSHKSNSEVEKAIAEIETKHVGFSSSLSILPLPLTFPFARCLPFSSRNL